MKQVHYGCVISKQDSAGILLNCSLASRLVIESSGAESLSGPDNVDDRIRSTRARARIPISQLTFEFNGVWRTDKKEGSVAPITEGGRRNRPTKGVKRDQGWV